VGRAYQVSAGNPFALPSHVGEDCAGAVQFVTPDRVHAVLAGHGGVRWLTVDDVAQRLRVLRRDPTAWHLHETGQFSLAGAQAKTALHHDPGTGRWGEPHGAVPTTHIVKPAITGLDDHDLNEHLCLTAVRALGLPAAISRVVRFGAERAVVVERYDRTRHDDGTVSRVHQEDMCQALGVPPTARYQNEGGPGPEQIIALIRTAVPACLATATVDAFTGALAVNWLLAGTDAHAKNYSLLLAGPQVRLAPLYDIASALPYDGRYLPKLRMAMKIGGEYRVTATTGRHWRRFAQANGLDPQAVVDQVDGLAAHLPDALATAGRDPAVRALRSPLPARLLDAVADLAAGCRAGLRHRDG